jgi:hypothetical protein
MQKISHGKVYTLTSKFVKYHGEGHPECPFYTTEEVLEERHYIDYSKEVQEVIDLITLQENIEPVGSSKYKVHKYPSDIDLFEPVEGCCTINSVRFPMARRIQDAVRRIKSKNHILFARFQCGYDRRYDVYIGEEVEGKLKDYNHLVTQREIENLFFQGLITEEDAKWAIGLAVKYITVDDFLAIYWFLRKRMMVDWTEDDILQGYKQLPMGKRLYLYDALIDKSLVKLDVWAKIPYPDLKGKRFVEITNWFLVQYKNDKGEIQNLSIVQEDRVKSLRYDIYKYLGDRHFDELKAAKRYWNYLFELEQTPEVLDELKKLAPLFSSYVAFLNSVLTDWKLNHRLYKINFLTSMEIDKFEKETKQRLANYHPTCSFDGKLNNKLIDRFSTRVAQKGIEDLTEKFLKDHKVDILSFLKRH